MRIESAGRCVARHPRATSSPSATRSAPGSYPRTSRASASATSSASSTCASPTSPTGCVLLVAGRPLDLTPEGPHDARPDRAGPGRYRYRTSSSQRPRPRAARRRWPSPAGALGRLEDLAVWIARCRGRARRARFDDVRVVVFAGDHGIASAGVSAYPREVTGLMVRTFVAGGAAVNVLARQVGASVRVVDLAVDADLPTCPAAVTQAQGASRQWPHRHQDCPDSRAGADGLRGRHHDRRRGGRRRRRPAHRWRHGHRQHDAGDRARGAADRQGCRLSGRAGHGRGRQRVDAQGRRGARRRPPRATARPAT